MSIADSILPLAKWSAAIPVIVEGRRFLVARPTVRQAIELHAAAPGALDGDRCDAEMVFDLLEDWLPDELFDAVAGLQLEEALTLVRTLLDDGTTGNEQQDDDSGDDDNDDAGVKDVTLLFGDYCQVYGGDPWTVYTTTPWAFFIGFLRRINAAAARDLLRWSEIEILPHSGKAAAKTLRSLQRRAQGIVDKRPPAFAPSEVIQRDRAALRKLFGAPPEESIN